MSDQPVREETGGDLARAVEAFIDHYDDPSASEIEPSAVDQLREALAAPSSKDEGGGARWSLAKLTCHAAAFAAANAMVREWSAPGFVRDRVFDLYRTGVEAAFRELEMHASRPPSVSRQVSTNVASPEAIREHERRSTNAAEQSRPVSQQGTTQELLISGGTHQCPGCGCKWSPLAVSQQGTGERVPCVCNIDLDGTPIYPDGEGGEGCPACGGRGERLIDAGAFAEVVRLASEVVRQSGNRSCRDGESAVPHVNPVAFAALAHALGKLPLASAPSQQEGGG